MRGRISHLIRPASFRPYTSLLRIHPYTWRQSAGAVARISFVARYDCQSLEQTMPDTFLNFINGQWVTSRSGRTFENLNPADRDDIVGAFPLSDGADVEDAAHAASDAFRHWRLMPAPKR